MRSPGHSFFFSARLRHFCPVLTLSTKRLPRKLAGQKTAECSIGASAFRRLIEGFKSQCRKCLRALFPAESSARKHVTFNWLAI
jgi:hypothetical protein